MVIDLSGINISGERLDKMINFLFRISDRIDLVSSNYNEMTLLEYDSALHQGELLRREQDLASGLTEEEIAEIYGEPSEDSLLDWPEEERLQEIDGRKRRKEAIATEISAREQSHLKSTEDIHTVINSKFRDLACTQRVVTSSTHCTLGGPCVVYSFPNTEKLQDLFRQMELLTWPLKTEAGEILAYDPAFYSQDNLVCSICSHERYITLHLDQVQADEFYSLGIPYNLNKSPKEIPPFPYLDNSVAVISLDGTISTLLGLGVYNYDINSPENFLQFYQWFDEHMEELRKEVKPCRKYVEEIIEYLKLKYPMDSYHSEDIEKQCLRHGWDNFYYRPRTAETNLIEDTDGNSDSSMPDLAPFLFRINYEGEELLVGGEYNSDYIFADLPEVEECLKDLLQNRDKRVVAISGRGSMTDSLLKLLKEINIYRGIDEYEKYNYHFFRAYMQILLYEDWISSK